MQLAEHTPSYETVSETVVLRPSRLRAPWRVIRPNPPDAARSVLTPPDAASSTRRNP